MHPASSLALGLLASVSIATAQIQCGTSPRSLEPRSIPGYAQTQGKRAQFSRESVSVQTYVHVIGAADTVEEGYYGDDIVEREIKILNNAFAPHDFSFHLVATDRIVNESWAYPDGNPGRPSSELDMRTALRRGGYSDLNIFFTPYLVPGGRCELPLPDPTSNDILMDGCLVKPQNEDDISEPEFNNVLIHEVGHWLGLWHTFDGGCEEPGDYVDDTPAEAYPSLGDNDNCPEEGRNTCPDRPGVDPVDNYMTYAK